jgi:NADH:ubiquinone reductase (H+-translocating)
MAEHNADSSHPLNPRAGARLTAFSLIGEGGTAGRYPLVEGKTTLGRDAENTIALEDPAVSRRHAQIIVSVLHDDIIVSDLNTSQGTYVNERRLGGPAPLRPGDVLRLGDQQFRLDGPRRHEVVILGGGFGGIYVALELQKQLRHRRDVGITLISRDNYFLFQPMLAELVSGSIETQHILNPVRRLLPRVQVLRADVVAVDLDRREVSVNTGFEDRGYPVAFDSLVVALGSVTDLSRLPGLTEHAILAKTVGDAFGLRNHALDMLEKADAEGDPEERQRLLSFIVAGGGFSGVEIMAELSDLLHDSLHLYPGIDRRELRLLLIQSGARILPEINEGLAAFATRKLAEKGIEVRTGSGVAALTPTDVTLRDGTVVPTRTLVATIGNRPHPLVETLACRRTERGALVVDEYLQTDVPGVYALGDVAAVPDLKHGGSCPPTAQYAIRQARFLAQNILANLDGRPKQPFVFGGLGQLASLGRRSAVAEVWGVRLSGWLAWAMWRMVYLSKLPGYERRLRVTVDWLLGALLPRDTVQLKLERTTSMTRAHYEPGQAIVHQGDVGSRFFLIVTGEVEVVREGPDGAMTRLAVLRAGEYFGELALLANARRNATVRALGPVDLLTMHRGDFLALATHGQFFGERLEAVVRERLAATDPAPHADDPLGRPV